MSSQLKDASKPPLPDTTAEDLFDASGRVSLDGGLHRKVAVLERTVRWYRNLLFGGVVLALGYAGYTLSQSSFDRLSARFPGELSERRPEAPRISDPEAAARYGPELLAAMRQRLVALGYPELTDGELAAWRDRGLTATYVGQMQEIGYRNLPLETAARLARADVSPQFAAMMKELGYTLSYDDMIRLRSAGVTAYFTGKLADAGLGNLKTDDLIRLRTVGVDETVLARYLTERGKSPTLDQLIRFHISNQ